MRLMQPWDFKTPCLWEFSYFISRLAHITLYTHFSLCDNTNTLKINFESSEDFYER
jgi:hypothetical protein